MCRVTKWLNPYTCYTQYRAAVGKHLVASIQYMHGHAHTTHTQSLGRLEKEGAAIKHHLEEEVCT